MPHSSHPRQWPCKRERCHRQQNTLTSLDHQLQGYPGTLAVTISTTHPIKIYPHPTQHLSYTQTPSSSSSLLSFVSASSVCCCCFDFARRPGHQLSLRIQSDHRWPAKQAVLNNTVTHLRRVYQQCLLVSHVAQEVPVANQSSVKKREEK